MRTLPLARYENVHTRDVDQAREMIGRALAPHRLQVLGRRGDFDARQHTAPIGAMALCYVRYGAEVKVTPETIDSRYLIHIPLTGAVDTDNGVRQVRSTRTVASVAQPGLPYRMHWRPKTDLLLARFDAHCVQRTLGQMLGYPPRGPLRFELGIDLGTPEMRSWLDVVNMIRRDTDRGRPLASSPLALTHLEDLLTTGLLTAARHSHSELLHNAETRAAPPRRVQLAIDVMRARLTDPITVHDIAQSVGLATRSLQEGFQKHLGTTPMAYLNRLRLDKAHADLIQADAAGTTVTAIATKWGFTNSSRFAEAHRRAYGETPAQTLKRPPV
ncbi:MAG: AraC family transcriptional regulator [Micromonosporaceae bacterium]